MIPMLKRLLILLKIVKKRDGKRKLPKNYIQNNNKVWRLFCLSVLCLSLSSFGATVNWQVSNLKNQNVAVYGFTGDSVFRQKIMDSLANNTFSSLMNNTPVSQKLGNYTSNSSGYVKSGNFTISNSIKKYPVFVISFDTNDINNYSTAYVTQIQNKSIKKTGVNTFTFNMNTFAYDTVYPVPEPSATSLLLISALVIVYRRPKIV